MHFTVFVSIYTSRASNELLIFSICRRGRPSTRQAPVPQSSVSPASSSSRKRVLANSSVTSAVRPASPNSNSVAVQPPLKKYPLRNQVCVGHVLLHNLILCMPCSKFSLNKKFETFNCWEISYVFTDGPHVLMCYAGAPVARQPGTCAIGHNSSSPRVLPTQQL
jgi:hypothetical protein